MDGVSFHYTVQRCQHGLAKNRYEVFCILSAYTDENCSPIKSIQKWLTNKLKKDDPNGVLNYWEMSC